MAQLRLNKIEVQGFRSFGTIRQSPDLPSSIAVFWGGNSQGKTSLAEALEFLFSGQIARRELLASAKDEFSEALRNVHLQPADNVSVEAHINCPDGKVRKLTRTLVDDYRRGNAVGCTSKLFIDGVPCDERDIEAILGLRLSQPPLRAPILAQHTLSYLFSASPTDRSAYFRAILDTQDLEDYRGAVAALQSSLIAPDHAELRDLGEVETIPVLAMVADTSEIRHARATGSEAFCNHLSPPKPIGDRPRRHVGHTAASAKDLLNQAIINLADWNALDDMRTRLSRLEQAQQTFVRRLSEYEQPAKNFGEALSSVLDKSADTKGWEPLVRLARNPGALWDALSATTQHNLKTKALEKAVREIDVGNGKVQAEKFGNLSSEVLVWWNKLRPDENTFFSAVQRRGEKTRRTIDLKAGLSTKEDRSDPRLRDAVAVFSQSQLHCLGLSIFLAKAVQENSGFVVMDDPVLTSDDDYRPNFTSSVMEELLARGIQVIVCTQDHKSRKDIGERWRHKGATQYQIIKNDVLLGSEIRSENDDLATMIAKAQPLAKSQDAAVREEGAMRVREAIERFSKCVLVKHRQANGDSAASITDHDGKNFGNYSGQVFALLTKDPSHPGKLKTAHANASPGAHDDKPPSKGELVQALGDLKFVFGLTSISGSSGRIQLYAAAFEI